MQNKEYPKEEDVKNAEQTLAQKGINYITILDEEYPDYLKQQWKPPFVLFYRGDINFVKTFEDNIAFIGSRDLDAYNNLAIEKVFESEEIKGKNVVIGRLNKGTATKVLENALKNGNKVIVVENSFDKNFITDKGGLIITESISNNKDHYYFANIYKNMSNMSTKVIVGALKKQSSQNILLMNAINTNKDIVVIPQPIYADYVNNQLIKNGADIFVA